MGKKLFSVLLLCLLLFSAGQKIHAVPNTLHWQGKIYVQTLPFSGTGEFKFILHDGSTCLWSNTSGTSCSALTQPASSVTRSITQGLYAVDLGDTTLINMAALPASTFSGSTVYLRIWFNDGVNGFQQLSPDEKLASVPFAMFTNSVGTANIAEGVPQLTDSQMQAISSPEKGRLVFNTTSDKLNVYDGSTWVEVGTSASLVNASYDTGWIQNTGVDWTNVEFSAAHNLNSPLSGLLVKFLISPDGTDANSYEISNTEYSVGGANVYGYMIYAINNNSLKVQTGAQGIVSIKDDGTAQAIDTDANENYYYKIKIYKLSDLAGGGNSYWSLSGNNISYVSGNVGIGTDAPNANAILDVSSTTKAFLPPRMTTTQRDAISSPIAGMTIFNSTQQAMNVYTSTGWTAVTSSGNIFAKDTAFLTLSSNQTSGTNVAINHIEFNQVIGNLALSTGSGQANGTITLIAGRKYRLHAVLFGTFTVNTTAHTWYDETNNVALTGSKGRGGSSTIPVIVEAIVTPVTNIEVSLRFGDTNTTRVDSDSTMAWIESVEAYVPNAGFVSSTGGTISGDLTLQGKLDMTSTTKAFLPPRMTTTQRDAISSPTEGMLVYNTTTDELNIYNGSSWTSVASAIAGSNSYLRRTNGTTKESNNVIIYSTAQESNGTDISYLPSASNGNLGDSFTINTSGIYAISATARVNSVSDVIFQINVSNNIQSGSDLDAFRTNSSCDVSAGNRCGVSWTGYISAGQKVYTWFNGDLGGAGGVPIPNQITITKISGNGGSSQWSNNGLNIYYTSGNVGIGTNAPNANAALDVSSTTKAFLPPRMTTTQRDAISSPIAGMTIFNSTQQAMNVYTSTGWTAVTSSGNIFAKDTAYLTLSTNQSAPVANDRFAFDTIVGNLTLSSGRVTLRAGRKYILRAHPSISYGANDANGNIQWYDFTNTTYIGNRGLVMSVGANDVNSGQSIASAVITPATDIQVELRIVSVSGAGISNIRSVETYAWIESVEAYVPNAGFVSSTGGTISGDLTLQGKLDMTSTTKAFLPPRMTTTQRDAISSPVAGMFIYNTDTSAFNYRTASGWQSISTGNNNLITKDSAFLTLSADQSSGFTVGDHIQFNTVVGNLALSTGSGQDNGKVTLIAGRKYRLIAGGAGDGSNANASYAWYTSAGVALGGTQFKIDAPSDTQSAGFMSLAETIYTPVVDTQVEVRLVQKNSLTSLYSSYTYAYIESMEAYLPAVPTALISSWTTFTPTGSWVTNSTYTGFYRRIGDTMEVRVKIALSGAPTAANLTVNIPSGFTIDTSKLVSVSASEYPILMGTVSVYDTPTTDPYLGVVYYSTTTAVAIETSVSNSTYTYSAALSATAPMTFAAGDIVFINYSVPIAEWAF